MSDAAGIGPAERPAVEPACRCWPDYSTLDAPSLDLNDDCPRHGGQSAVAYDGPDPY